MTLTKSYEPEHFETKIYQSWEEQGCFEAEDTNAPGQKSFCIVIPPPNVTGALHIGHALSYSIQDSLIRWRRMRGDNTLWLPGTDHAGIATQAQVEKQITKEGKGPTGKPLTRHDLGREAFLARTWKWKEDHEGQIRGQLKRLGCSLDWKRERFTMDEGLSHAVREVFVDLYNDGLIYRADRIINWCTKCQTALSDLEVVPTDRKGSLWHLKYPIVEKAGKPLLGPDGQPATVTIATTRPETMLGDTAIAIHPEDERYTHLHGKFAKLPILDRIIPIILDDYVDREFGSGALKVTPAHDFNDYELGKRHALPSISVMGKEGRITAEGGPYSGLKFAEAREKIIETLTQSGVLIKTEDHANKVGLCQRSETVVEPIISKQWWVKVDGLAREAIEVVESGKIEFSPKNWEKTYFEWMRNIRDWCISRQLWWGHQIPAWYCGRCEQITVAKINPTSCAHCKAPASDLKQDEDVLDTWFSSGLWPFSTLGWPQKTQALNTFYPTAILETGFDIIFFWVARMIMMGNYFMKQVPFHKVYMHAMVRDEKGEKMSKSKGNVIDPLVIMDQFGTDPLRFTLAAMSGQGRDIKLSVDRVEGYRGFCNKIWNATKFFHLQFEPEQGGPIPEPQGGAEKWLLDHRAELLPANAWILSRLQEVGTRVEKGLTDFELSESAQAIYEFGWHELCDWYIEFSKLPLRKGGEERVQTLITLHYVLETLMRAAHPIMPYVTEELWQSLPWRKFANTPGRKHAGKPTLQTLMVQAFPDRLEEFKNPSIEESIGAKKSVIEAIRNFRGENNLSPKVEFLVRYVAKSPAAEQFVRGSEADLIPLARIKGMQKIDSQDLSARKDVLETVITLAHPALDLHIELAGLVNVEEESKRVRKEMDRVMGDLEFVRNKLGKESFIAKAPAELVAKEKLKEQEYQDQLKELQATLSRLAKLGGTHA